MRNKLQSNKGASLLAALLVFFICAMVGTVVVTAASAGIQHVQARKAEQQEYLTLSSAAELVAGGIKNVKFTETQISVRYECQDTTDRITDTRHTDADYDAVPSVSAGTDAAGAMAALLQTMAAGIYDKTETIAEGTITIAPGTGDPALQTVTVKFTMDSAYHLTATLSLPDGCHYSPFYLTFTPDAPAPTPNVVTTSEPHSVGSWGWQWVWNGKKLTYSHIWTVTTKYYDVATTTTVTNVGWTFSSLTKGTVVT